MIDLFVANFPYDTEQSELMTIFSTFGPVESVKIIVDRETGYSRGFGFVRMEKNGGHMAVSSLNMANFGGRALTVREARPLQRKMADSQDRYQSGRYDSDYQDYGSENREYTYRY
jgi:RNA recognition motif-containing protein